MKKNRRKVAREKIWEKIKPFSKMNFHPPSKGWIKTIREAFGMTSYQMANRMGISQSSLMGIEKREKQKTISLQLLEEAAKALHCKVEYILIPEEPLENIVTKRATKLAQTRLKETTVSMALEDQSVSTKDTNIHLKHIISEIIEKSDSEIWEE